jgi:hypothetical protein
LRLRDGGLPPENIMGRATFILLLQSEIIRTRNRKRKKSAANL